MQYFDSYEIGPLLQRGTNWLAAEIRTVTDDTFKLTAGAPGVLLQIEDGERVATDSSWQARLADDWRSDAPLYTFQIGRMERRDLRKSPTDWAVGAGARWPRARAEETFTVCRPTLLPRDIPALTEQAHTPTHAFPVVALPMPADLSDDAVAQILTDEKHQPLAGVDGTALTQPNGQVVVLPTKDTGASVVVDFGREVNGSLEIDIEGPAGTVLDVGYDERSVSGRLTPAVHVYQFADRYVLSGERITVTNSLSERGFRMAQIAVRKTSGPVHVHGVRAVDRTYPFARRGSFSSSDPLLNDIWMACIRTLEACATDTFVDCPWRENAFYLNDLLVESLTAVQAFGDPRLSARCLSLAASQRRPDGLIPAAVPYGAIPRMSVDESAEYLTFPAANLMLARLLEDYLRYTGRPSPIPDDVEVLRQIIDTVSTWSGDDGMIRPPKSHWNFVDWSYEINKASLDGQASAALSWLFVHALDAAANVADWAGRRDQAADWRAAAQRAADQADGMFWDNRFQCYREFHEDEREPPFTAELPQALALLSGRAPRERVPHLTASLVGERLVAPELYLHHFVLRALARVGEAGHAIERVRRYWGAIVQAGSPTIWECGVHASGRAAFNNAGSLCHGFATTPIDFLQSTVLGVMPLRPGFAECRIAPDPADLDDAAGTVPTPHGPIDIAWRRQGDRLTVELALPPGVTAVLGDGRVLPSGQHVTDYRPPNFT